MTGEPLYTQTADTESGSGSGNLISTGKNLYPEDYFSRHPDKHDTHTSGMKGGVIDTEVTLM